MKSELIAELFKLLKNHEEWEQTFYGIKHKSGLKIWVDTMPFFIHVYEPKKILFSFFEQLRLWKPITKCLKAIEERQMRHILEKIKKD